MGAKLVAMTYASCQRLLVALSCLALTAFTSLEKLFAPTHDLWARWGRHDNASDARIDHSNWTALLKKTVRRDSKGVDRVDYAAYTAAYTAADRKRLVHYINRYFPDGIRIGANRRRTPPPMERFLLCGHPTVPI